MPFDATPENWGLSRRSLRSDDIRSIGHHGTTGAFSGDWQP